MSEILSSQASYDSDGNIILSRGTNDHDTNHDAHYTPHHHSIIHPHQSKKAEPMIWHATDEEVEASSLFSGLATVFHSFTQLIARFCTFGTTELSRTREAVFHEYHRIVQEMENIPHDLSHLKNEATIALSTPLALPPSLDAFLHPKPSQSWRRFFLDTLRFGVTFACIFAFLFILINYQSFFQIASATFALTDTKATEVALESVVKSPALLPSSPLLASDRLSPLAFLPSVGPSENRLIIPKIGKNVPIVEPSIDSLVKEDWKKFEADIQDSLRDGVVHYPGSARPGQAGNFFITGHSSYYPWDSGKYKDVFARLHELTIGDVYYVYYGGDKHAYRITGKKEVSPTDVSVLDQPMDTRMGTLMTCTPLGTTLRRLILTAEEIDPITQELLKPGEEALSSVNDRLKKLENLSM